ncbi:MAG: hypothetical protein V3W09_04005 [Nitrososphaerales archaeon]
MMRNKYFAILPLAILGIFAFSLVANPLNYALAQQEGDGRGDEVEVAVEGTEAGEGNKTRVKTEKIIEIMVKAEDHIRAVFARLEDRGVEIPDAVKESFGRGLNISESAVLAFNEGRVEEAGESAIAAMNEFKESMRLLKGANVTASAPAPRGIEQAINRTRIFIERLEGITEKAEEQGYNTTDIRARIDRAKTILDNATELLNEGEVNEAAKKIGEAKRAVTGLIGELNRISKAEKSRRINEFVDKALERLTDIEEKAEELLPPQAAEKVKAAIERAKAHLNQTRNLVEQKRIGNAIDALEDMIGDAEESHNELSREMPAVAQRFEAAVSNIKNRLTILQNEVNRLNVTDTTVVKEMLVNASNLLQKASEDLRSGDLRAVSKTLKTLDKLIDNIEDSIKDPLKNLEEGRRNGPRGAERQGRR